VSCARKTQTGPKGYLGGRTYIFHVQFVRPPIAVPVDTAAVIWCGRRVNTIYRTRFNDARTMIEPPWCPCTDVHVRVFSFVARYKSRHNRTWKLETLRSYHIIVCMYIYIYICRHRTEFDFVFIFYFDVLSKPFTLFVFLYVFGSVSKMDERRKRIDYVFGSELYLLFIRAPETRRTKHALRTDTRSDGCLELQTTDSGNGMTFGDVTTTVWAMN